MGSKTHIQSTDVRQVIENTRPLVFLSQPCSKSLGVLEIYKTKVCIFGNCSSKNFGNTQEERIWYPSGGLKGMREIECRRGGGAWGYWTPLFERDVRLIKKNRDIIVS